MLHVIWEERIDGMTTNQREFLKMMNQRFCRIPVLVCAHNFVINKSGTWKDLHQASEDSTSRILTTLLDM